MENIESSRLIHINKNAEEVYEILRNEIQFYGRGMKIIGVTSCCKEKGKSIVSLNLAVSIAETGKKVIYIDTDICKQTSNETAAVDETVKGLSDYLISGASKDEIIYHTDIDHLDLIFSGSYQTKAPVISGIEKIEELIKEEEENYDYIIVETPPNDVAMDGAEIAKVCDGMVLVLKANAVSYKLGRETRNKLEMIRCKILGAVLLQGA
jgi:capsular exopolysaccharide synthesis family protein